MDHDAFSRSLSLAVHELRTPVTVVAGYLRMLNREQGGPITDRQRKMLDEAERSCARVSALISELSELGHLENDALPLRRVVFDLCPLLHELAGNMQAGDDGGVRVEARCPTDPVPIIGDRTRLGASIRALLQASVREHTEPGIVYLECAVRRGADPLIVVVIGNDAALPALRAAAASDTRHFDEWRGGMGLALPIARRIIERHGGAVWSVADTRGNAALQLPLFHSGADAAS